MKNKINFLLFFYLFKCLSFVNSEYNVGVGIADCTGPPTEITFVSFLHNKK